MPIAWNERYADRTRRMSSSAIRDLLKVTEQPDFISFAGGMPAPEVFPVGEVAAAAEWIMRAMGPTALQYGATEGYRPLRQLIADRMTRDGVPATVDNILITTGSQQGLDLIGKVFVDRDERVLAESPAYLAALQAWNAYGARYEVVPMDEDGMVVDDVERALRSHPTFIYCLPNFQNPSGVTLAESRRVQLVELARKHGIPIVEDDPYRELRFEGEHLPRLIELAARDSTDGDREYHEHVIYLCTFSKVLSPGLRVGWVVAPAEVIVQLTRAKQGADLHTAGLNQMIAYELLSSGIIDRHLDVIVQAYRERRDVMLTALTQHFPAGARWTRPAGGMFLWVTLPEGIDADDVLQDAIALKVAFVPGAPFHPQGGGENTFRLNFSNPSPAQIEEGIARLGRVLSHRICGGDWETYSVGESVFETQGR